MKTYETRDRLHDVEIIKENVTGLLRDYDTILLFTEKKTRRANVQIGKKVSWGYRFYTQLQENSPLDVLEVKPDNTKYFWAFYDAKGEWVLHSYTQTEKTAEEFRSFHGYSEKKKVLKLEE